MTVPFPVVPADPNNADIVRTNSQKVKAKVTLLMRKQLHYWAVLHISYRGGRYSIERLLSLDAYTRTTPVARVVFVCLAAPGSLALFILALESVPLQDPAAGWAGNYGYWVRVAIAAMVVANGFFVQVKIFVKGCRIQPWQLLLMVVGAAVLETPVAIAVSALTWFPVPFSIITMAPSFYPVLLFVFYAVVGREVIREMLKHIDQVIQYLKFTAALQLMAVIYPMYQVLFLAVNDTHYELPVMLLLPVLKLTIKNVILRCVTHMEDMMPEAVIFTADLFNALYMATSMESATSKITVVIIVMIDIVQSAIVLYCLKDRTNSTLARLAQVTGVTIDVIAAASQICRSSEIFKKQNRQRLRIRSCLPHKLSTNDRDLLERLERISTLDSLRRHTSPARTDTITVDTRVVFESRQQLSKALTWADRREPTVRIPAGTIITTKQPSMLAKSQGGDTSLNPQREVLRRSLELLFTTECLLLSATLDASVPLLYGNFLLVLIHLPAAKYHTELTNVTKENIGDMVDTVFLFSFVEIVCFALLARLIFQNLRINAFYHLAFVLETQQELIRAKLMLWFLMTMAFRVSHFGIDFTFQFAWLFKE